LHPEILNIKPDGVYKTDDKCIYPVSVPTTATSLFIKYSQFFLFPFYRINLQLYQSVIFQNPQKLPAVTIRIGSASFPMKALYVFKKAHNSFNVNFPVISIILKLTAEIISSFKSFSSAPHSFPLTRMISALSPVFNFIARMTNL